MGNERTCCECGKPTDENDMINCGDSWVCAECKPAFTQKIKEGAALPNIREYAGFWIRAGAKVIDVIILQIVNIALLFTVQAAYSNSENSGLTMTFVPIFINFLIAVSYTTWFLGKYGATLGKMACQLEVITADNEPISYLRAFGRHFSEAISGFILGIGYLMVCFDDEKRALHDRMCNTRVVIKKV